MLPAGFISYGVGVTPPPLRSSVDRIFVFKPDLSRAYLDVDMDKHALCKGDQHEARIKIVTSSGQNVNFPGEIIATTAGQLLIAVPRTTLFGKGIQIFERYIFAAVEMPFSLPILTHGGDIVREGDKILLNGIGLN
jgi:hypothetical protein